MVRIADVSTVPESVAGQKETTATLPGEASICVPRYVCLCCIVPVSESFECVVFGLERVSDLVNWCQLVS